MEITVVEASLTEAITLQNEENFGDIKVINMVSEQSSQQLTSTMTVGNLRSLEETPNEEKFEEVEKILPNESNELIIVSTSQSNDALEIYKKMNINALKAEVVSKGLCSDTSKLKKVDIMKLLEKYHKEK